MSWVIKNRLQVKSLGNNTHRRCNVSQSVLFLILHSETLQYRIKHLKFIQAVKKMKVKCREEERRDLAMTEKALRVVVLERFQTIRSPESRERLQSVAQVCEILK